MVHRLSPGMTVTDWVAGPAVSADTAGPATQSVTVMPGDSLWTIATTVAPEADVYEVIATIDELNGLEGRAPAPGEELFVPAMR